MTVEDGGILYKMEDLAKLSEVYERLCTMEYIFDNREQWFDDWEVEVTSKEQAYALADEVRDKMSDICCCETSALEGVLYWHQEVNACIDAGNALKIKRLINKE